MKINSGGHYITQEPGTQELLHNWGFISKMEMCKNRQAREHSSCLTYSTAMH